MNKKDLATFSLNGARCPVRKPLKIQDDWYKYLGGDSKYIHTDGLIANNIKTGINFRI